MANIHLDAQIAVNQGGPKYYPPKIHSMKHFSVVYVVAPGLDGPCKIGITQNITQRLRGIQSGCWERVVPYGFRFGLRKRGNVFDNNMPKNLEDGARQLERVVLSKVDDLGLSLYGEWTDLTPCEALEVIDKCGRISDVGSMSLDDLAGVEIDAGLDASMAAMQRRLVAASLEITGMIQNLNGIGHGAVDLD